MQLEEFRNIVAAKNAADLSADARPEACEIAFQSTAMQALDFRHRSGPGPAAVDPTFWLTIIQLLVPIFLEWINRRFPRPSPPTA